MRFIRLTNMKGNLIVVNVAHIGHLYPVGEKVEYGRTIEIAHTIVGVTTHNNGGFKVTETVDQIMKLINKM
jgi:hypothetical protein